MSNVSYAEAIRDGFVHLLANHDECFAIGQGLWSPWYVGSSMRDLDKMFGRERVIDSPVSELATTAAAIGASLHGYRPIMIHPRMDFMILAADALVNQAAKWRHMLGGEASPAVTIRSIINRGGEQGAQHSQALHAWYAHIPGLKVVMPATPTDARDLLIAAALSDDPVLYIDDRWLYEWSEEMDPPSDIDLGTIGPRVLREGTDITLVAASYSVKLALDAAQTLSTMGVSCEVVDLRIINPLDPAAIIASVSRTGRLLAIDGGWSTCGLAGEVIALASERLRPSEWRAAPRRLTLPDAPAPTSRVLEEIYYPKVDDVVTQVNAMMSAPT